MGEGQHGLVGFQLGTVDGFAQLEPGAADRFGLAAGEAGAGGFAPAGAHYQGYAVVAGDFHRSGMQHRSPQAGQLEHFVTADLVHQLGVGHPAGVGGEHPGYIGVDLAGVGPECCGERHG